MAIRTLSFFLATAQVAAPIKNSPPLATKLAVAEKHMRGV
jgi:hypothetical protein